MGTAWLGNRFKDIDESVDSKTCITAIILHRDDEAKKASAVAYALGYRHALVTMLPNAVLLCV